MKLKKLIIENYKGINNKIDITIHNFNCIVGKNDVGKSTILKAIDAFINDNGPTADDKNIYNESNLISVEMQFDAEKQEVVFDETLPVTFEDEDFVNQEGLLSVKKTWDITNKTIKPEWYIYRKKYNDDDFSMLIEKDLKRLCQKYQLEPNQDEGNRGMRNLLRNYYNENDFGYSYDYEKLQTTGQTRSKKIFDAIKQMLPNFEYFRADKSLSDSDTSVQKYFKDKALTLLKTEIDTNDIESKIKEKIGESLGNITDKINSVLSENEQISAQIDFDWAKLISTSFKCKQEEANIPLSSRGDGFRRITMMSYFEMLAEEKKADKDVIFGFEEPETFLHPGTQRLLYQKLHALMENGYQVAITTHSPNIVAETNLSDIIFVTKAENYQVFQNDNIDIKEIVEELGIKSDSGIISVFDNVKCLFLVEGPDDIVAMKHLALEYKNNHKIEYDFDELNVVLIPVGGCDSIKHWTNFNTITKLGKPYFIYLDSDKVSQAMDSPNMTKLVKYGYTEQNCAVSRKREIENYIPDSYYKTLNPPINDISYGDWDDVKCICKNHRESGRLGGNGVCARHFKNLTYDQLRQTFCPDNKDENDEFLFIYNKIKGMIQG